MEEEQLVRSPDQLGAIEGEKRVRQLTEKGAEWQLKIIQCKLRTSFSQWKRLATECSVLLSDCDDCGQIREQRSKLEVCFNTISEITGEFSQFDESDISDMVNKFEGLEGDHVHLMAQISETLRSLQSERGSGTSKQTRSSHQLSQLTKMQHLAESVRLKTKLEFHDAESQMKADLERLQTIKQLVIVNTNNVQLHYTVDDVDEQFPKLSLSAVQKY